MSKVIVCPLMSCRVTKMDEQKIPPTITPSVVKCQEDGCAFWDAAERMCAVKSIAVQLIKLGEIMGR